MAEKSNIEWCDSTLNWWEGCTKVGPGCDHCYAEARNARFGGGAAPNWGPGAPRRLTSEHNRSNLRRWNKRPFCECPACGWRGEERDANTIVGLLNIVENWCPECHKEVVKPARRRVFCSSLSDVFDNEVPTEWRADLLNLVRQCPNLDFLLLTKRIGNVVTLIEEVIRHIETLSDWSDTGPAHPLEPLRNWLANWMLLGKAPANVWIGATICNQAEADRDIPKLLAVPAAVRFLSIEPLLGPVDLHYTRLCIQAQRSQLARAINGETWLDWVIVGGESGPKARPMHPDLVRSLRDQCAAAGVPFLFKQWGEWTPGENVEKRTGVVQSATWFNGAWLMGTEDLACEDGHIDDEPDLYRVGKKAAGRLLDGVEHNGYPEEGA